MSQPSARSLSVSTTAALQPGNAGLCYIAFTGVQRPVPDTRLHTEKQKPFL